MGKISISWRVVILLIVLLLLSGSMVLVGTRPAYAMARQKNSAQATTFIDTWDNIHVFQPFDYNIDDPTSVANHYDFVWGASPYAITAWRNGNPDIFLSYYMLFDRDSGTFSNLMQNHDLAWWQTNHPDWVLYQCDGKTPAYKFGEPNTVPLDFSNPAVIDWQIQTYAVPAANAGYDGIAADNVDLGNWYHACGVYKNGTWIQLYSGQDSDSAWNTNIFFWLSHMRNALHALSHPLALIPNMSLGSVVANQALLPQVVNNVDGLFEEAGFTDQGHSYLTDEEWVLHMSLIANLQAQGKPYYSNNQFSSVGQTEIQWALASYLMCKYHAAYLSISGYQQYGVALWYQEYTAQIGTPLADMSLQQQVYWRSYSHGLTVVNPSSANSYTITLPTLPTNSHYGDLYGNRVSQTVTLPVHSSVVLLIA